MGYVVVVGLVGHVVVGLLVVVVIGCTPGGKDPDTGGCYSDLRKRKLKIKFDGLNFFTVGAA